MSLIIPISRQVAQSTLGKMIDADPVMPGCLRSMLSRLRSGRSLSSATRVPHCPCLPSINCRQAINHCAGHRLTHRHRPEGALHSRADSDCLGSTQKQRALSHYAVREAVGCSHSGGFKRFHILVECDHLLGIFVDLVVGDLAPGDFAEDHAPVGIDDGSVCSGACVCKPQAGGGVPGRPRDEHLLWFESQADLVDTPHPPLDLLSASKLPCPGVVSGEDKPDVAGIGAEQRLKVAFSQRAQVTTEHEAHRPCVQRGEQAQESDQRCDEDGRLALGCIFLVQNSGRTHFFLAWLPLLLSFDSITSGLVINHQAALRKALRPTHRSSRIDHVDLHHRLLLYIGNGPRRVDIGEDEVFIVPDGRCPFRREMRCAVGADRGNKAKLLLVEHALHIFCQSGFCLLFHQLASSVDETNVLTTSLSVSPSPHSSITKFIILETNSRGEM